MFGIKRLTLEIQVMSAIVDRLKAAVTNLTTVTASNNALLSTLAQEIRDNKDDPAALEAIASELEGDTQSISDAVKANTPAEGETPAGDETQG